ncbi:NADH-ubiquinone oxidoreductase-F iron-sulfur binding region domain-containing protein [Actinophytocola sp.]|uniref:NADH-ubiquinone oxidoreductase-F iron-sulfur binding region domain-containing protein n=1 Tax=Actinophytocola sp. TaxID=1872138 RepID=UPI002ED9CBA0
MGAVTGTTYRTDLSPRLLAGFRDDDRPLTLAEHERTHGPPPRAGGRDGLVRLAASVGLRGRGGAAYPLAAKLAAVSRRRGPAVVVVNGAESEPASYKDAVLLAGNPHLVLDGAMLAAAALGAGEVVVWLHDESDPVRRAIEERADPVSTRIAHAPAGYVTGQSSALTNHLSRGRAVPTPTPPHATERGVAGRPTLVSNAETLAHLALLARRGAAWFRSVGTDDEPGTTLITVTGAVRRTLVREVAFGTPLGEVVPAGELVEPPAAVLVGGYAGTWLPWPFARTVALSARGLRAVSAQLGVGMVAVLPASRCGLAETAHLATWLAGETAGQCGPCVRGLPDIAAAMRALAGGGDQDVVRRLHRWTGMVAGRGLCHHPDGVSRLVRSALRAFEPEVTRHLAGECRAAARGPVFPVPS